jgi:thiol-disulfide isomerase/thioredoxin
VNRLKRRGWLVGASVAGVAVAAGIGGALWRSRGDDVGDLWSTSFDTPAGGRIDLAALRGRPLVLNFWATWCAPCVREMPALDRFFADFKARGWQVLGIAADQAAPVREFLARTPVAYPVALAGFAGIELSRRLGNEAGGLPFTVAFDGRERIMQRHMGESSYELLATWATGIS